MCADATIAAPETYTVEAAYAWCERLARSHYENFPVASHLLPAAMRRPTAVIYAFARTADDYADEGSLAEAQRLALLDGYAARLAQLTQGKVAGDPVFVALADVIERHALPLTLFSDLLSAFRQDVTCRRYPDFAALLDYCRRSANPVGRLLLHLHGDATPENLALSDRICSALQLINFYQDLAQDYDENGRIYIPVDEMQRYGVDDSHFRDRRNDSAVRRLLAAQYARARAMMLAGAPLGRRLRGRFGWEIRLIIEGGLRVLDRLEENLPQAPFARPRLRSRDWPVMLWRTLSIHRARPDHDTPQP